MKHVRTLHSEGFTLIEMIVVIAILGLLMAAAVPGYFALQKWATKRAARQTLLTIKGAISTYKLTTNSYPHKLEELLEKPSDQRLAAKWAGPYLQMDVIPLDPWGNDYVYQVTPGGKHAFELHSEGDPDDQDRQSISAWTVE